MRILYVAPKYDYGDPTRGFSFEHYNFHDTLTHMGHDVTYFDLLTEYQQHGRMGASIRLRSIVQADKPDLLFCVLFTHELDMKTIGDISQHTDTVTYNWFCDDHWRFDNFSRHWAPAFNWVSTTAASAVPKYRDIGYKNVVKTQWACNHFLYQPSVTPTVYDVTFVGQPHGTRRETIAALRKAGIAVQTWGHGWETGRLTQEEMIALFSTSRVNLNLSNASVTGTGWKGRLRWQRNQLSQQIKGRNFEIPGCGGFTLTGNAENLDQYYALGDEVGVFDDVSDLVEKVKYYLDHEPERQRIAQAGYVRTIAEHTYEKRFNDIFTTIGLETPMRQASPIWGGF